MWGAAAHEPTDSANGRLVTAGSLDGTLEMVAEPVHTQFGDVVKRLPKQTYLALHVQSCVDLIGKKVCFLYPMDHSSRPVCLFCLPLLRPIRDLPVCTSRPMA